VDKTLLLFIFGLLLFASPLVGWWATPASHWLVPYVLWGILIVLIALAAHYRER
jgi:hypothetical protein